MKQTTLLLLLIFVLTLGAQTAKATESTYVDHTVDYFVVVAERQRFEAETDLCDNTEEYWCATPESGGYFTDSVLWLYDSEGIQITVNDDDPRKQGQSWNSWISLELEPGVYRLRAGRFSCDDTGCIHPSDPFPVGGHYTLNTNLSLLLDPTPPQESPLPIPSELPSPEPSESATPEPSPSIEPSPDSSPSSEPTPSATPEQTPSMSPDPSPDPSPVPSPTHTHTPAPSIEPSPTPEPPPAPSPEPSIDPTPEPSAEPPTPLEDAATAVADALENTGKALTAAVKFIGNLGAEITPEEREQARATIIPAVVISQIAAAATAAASAAAATGSDSTPSGGSGRKGKR